MDIQEYLSRARSALADGELDLAERYFKHVLTQNPENADALQGFKEIEVAHAKKNWSILKRWTFLVWGNFLKILGKPDKAYSYLEMVHRVNLVDIPAAMSFADCAKKVGKLAASLEAYRQILLQNATHINALRGEAEILIQLGHMEEAAKVLEKLVTLCPRDDRLSHQLRDVTARAYAKTGIPENLKERRAAVEKHKRELPGTPELVERLESQLEAYRRNPNDKELAVQLAQHYREAGLFNEAGQFLAPILDSYSVYEPARREQARIWCASGELDIAVTLFSELLAANPHDQTLKDEYLQARITQLERLGEKKKDDKTLQMQIEKTRHDREINRIGLLRCMVTDHPEADAERVELGELLMKHGKIDEAIFLVQHLLHEPAWAGKGFFLLGQAFRAKGDKPLAMTQFEKSLDFFKNRGYSHVPTEELKRVYYYLGIVREELGDKKGALDAYGQIYAYDIQYKDIRTRYESLIK